MNKKADDVKSKPAGIYYLVCLQCEDHDYGSDVFILDGKKYRAISATIKFPDKIFVGAKVARVEFFNEGKIDSKGEYEFLVWVESVSE